MSPESTLLLESSALPDARTLLMFATAALLLYATPGADTVHLLSRSLTQGRRAGVMAALGTGTGLLLHTAAAVGGLGALLLWSPVAFAIIKWMGVAYLAWLGVRMLWASRRNAPDAPAAPATQRASGHRVYLSGVLVSLLNPKAPLIFLAFLPQFVQAHQGGAAQLAVLGVLFAAGAVCWYVGLALAASLAGPWVRSRPAFIRWQRRVTGVVFLALAGRLATANRP